MDIKTELKMLADYFGGDGPIGDDHIAAIIVKAAKVIESQEKEISDLHEHCASLRVVIECKRPDLELPEDGEVVLGVWDDRTFEGVIYHREYGAWSLAQDGEPAQTPPKKWAKIDT